METEQQDDVSAPERRSGRQIRLEDFKGPYAKFWTEYLANEARADEARAQVLLLEERLAGGLKELLDRSEQLVEHADRIEASITLATDMLGQQAKVIAKAFRDQLTLSEVDGVATLKTHMLEVADNAANAAQGALNQVADEAAAVAGVKAEAAALQRVTSTVVEEAKKGGLNQAVLALAGAAGRLQAAAERLETAQSQPAAAAPAAAPAPQHHAPEGLGALPLGWMWVKHHLGAPGLLIGLAGAGALAYKFLG
jgi:hypothetical protein